MGRETSRIVRPALSLRSLLPVALLRFALSPLLCCRPRSRKKWMTSLALPATPHTHLTCLMNARFDALIALGVKQGLRVKSLGWLSFPSPPAHVLLLLLCHP